MIAPRFDLGPSLVEFNRKLNQWVAFTGREVESVVRQEAALCLKDAINLTPPTIKNSRNDFRSIAPQVQRRAAEANIEKSVRIAFRPLQSVLASFERAMANQRSKNVNYPRVLNFLKMYSEQGRLRAVETILRDFHYRAIVVQKATVEIYHDLKAKNATKILVLDDASIERVIKKIIADKKKKVGTGKSGWNDSGKGLGAKIPRWVSDKSGRGSFTTDGAAQKFSVTMENAVGYVQKNPDAIVGEALRRRGTSMEKRMNAMLEKGIRAAK